MKKYFILLTIMSVLFACSKYDDSELRGRIEKLETFCNQLNTNVTSLQTIVEALQSKDYVTSVIPVYEQENVIGYTINFEKSGAITIYHGKKGETGQTPSIGVKQDTDGIYYWTLDGEWMTDENGNKIKAQGIDGQNAIAPQFKIENGYWFVSYNKGVSWEQIGQATGDKGDSMFEDIIIEEDNVQFILSDGTSFIVPRIIGGEITVNVGNVFGNSVEFKGTVLMPVAGENNYAVGVIYSKNGLLPIEESVMLPITSVEDGMKFSITTSDLEYATQYYYSYYIFKDGHYDIGPTKSFTTSSYLKCEVKIPGTLQDLISDEIKNKITGLEILGSINGTDIRFIRLLGGKDINNNNISSKLKKLNLANVNIVEGGDYYYKYNDDVYYTENHVIGQYMFHSLNIEEIDIPLSINLIDKWSFSYSKINHINFHYNITKIGESAFQSCENLRSITIPGNIKEIDKFAFTLCTNLSEIELEEGVEIIRWAAFGSDCYKTINIPQSVTLIEESAFSSYPQNSTVYYTGKFTTTDNKCVVYNNTLINYAAGNSSISYTIPDKITRIGQYAFSCGENLQKIKFSNSVKTIGSRAFQLCDNIENIELNDGLTSIEDAVFWECRKLSNITIPESVESIGEEAFRNLSEIKLNSINPPSIANNSINDDIKTIYVPEVSLEKYKSAPIWKNFSDRIVSIEKY